MKTAAIIMVFAISAFAQGSPASSGSHAACGPLKVNFNTAISVPQLPSQAEPGKALVYVVDDFPSATTPIGTPTIKVGLDGKWLGATRGRAYIFFSAEPGEHHLCVQWQSRLEAFSGMISLARLNAEAGKTYYFRARVYGVEYLDIDPIDSDEGQYLTASSQLSTAHPKK